MQKKSHRHQQYQREQENVATKKKSSLCLKRVMPSINGYSLQTAKANGLPCFAFD